MVKKPKVLKLKDTESVASLFTDDLVRYFRTGGDMKNLTAQKVYAKRYLRKSVKTWKPTAKGRRISKSRYRFI